MRHFQCLMVPMGLAAMVTEKRTSSQPVSPRPWSIENYAYGIEKLLLKTQVSEKFLHSEVNLIIQYINALCSKALCRHGSGRCHTIFSFVTNFLCLHIDIHFFCSLPYLGYFTSYFMYAYFFPQFSNSSRINLSNIILCVNNTLREMLPKDLRHLLSFYSLSLWCNGQNHCFASSGLGFDSWQGRSMPIQYCEEFG